jgi:hypothetical protein
MGERSERLRAAAEEGARGPRGMTRGTEAEFREPGHATLASTSLQVGGFVLFLLGIVLFALVRYNGGRASDLVYLAMIVSCLAGLGGVILGAALRRRSA